MKLRELDAEFVRVHDDGQFDPLPDAQGAQGVWLDCPCGTHRFVIWFKNPLGAEVAPPRFTPAPRWERTGSTLDDLTLSPSILHLPPGCGWHGWIRAGEVVKA